MENVKPRLTPGVISACVFWGLLIVLFLFFNQMARIEPVEGDGWFVLRDYKIYGPGINTIIKELYKFHHSGNPRIVNIFYLLMYHPWPIHQIMTPAAIVLLFITMFTVALGRRPHPTSLRDSYLLLVLIALCWLATPNVGQTFFYRPITSNYVYGFLCTLAFFIPHRLYLTSSFGTGRYWWILAIFLGLYGAFVGKCNEHTGPTAIVAALCLTSVPLFRQKTKVAAWMFSGSIGLIIGYLFLFYAPGQEKRYKGLGRSSLVDTLASRGVVGNLETAWSFFKDVDVLFVFTCLLLLASVLTSDRSKIGSAVESKAKYIETAIFIILSLMVLVTSLAAPKHFWRLTIASTFLLSMAVLVIVDIFSIDSKAIITVSVLALIVNFSFAYRSISFYSEINRLLQDRISRFNGKGPNDDVYLPLYPYPSSSMYYGDGIKSGYVTKAMADYYGVRKVKILKKTSPMSFE
jgi:hypothetical protein